MNESDINQYKLAQRERIKGINNSQAKLYYEQIESMSLSEPDKFRVVERLYKLLKLHNEGGTLITPFEEGKDSLIPEIVRDLDLLNDENDPINYDKAWDRPRPGSVYISPQNQARLRGIFNTK